MTNPSPLNEIDHNNQQCDHSIAGSVEEILSPHEFDNIDHPYWPEALHLARAAEKVALELIRLHPEYCTDALKSRTLP